MSSSALRKCLDFHDLERMSTQELMEFCLCLEHSDPLVACQDKTWFCYVEYLFTEGEPLHMRIHPSVVTLVHEYIADRLSEIKK